MGQKKLSKAIKTILASSLGIGFGLTSVAAFAADDDSNTKVQKITVTGSLIKGVAAQSASPITIVKTEELAKQGVTTAEQALATVSANSSGFNSSMNVGRSGTVGSAADLRGLGANKTLVLLNGRRLANSPFDTSTVDLSTIPLALIDRIEVLKDGASATYGTDAIGGVINFITKKEYTGGGISVGGGYPQMGGGQTQDYGLFGGYGHLDEDRFNVYGAFNYHKQEAVMASQRSFTRNGGVIPELGLNKLSGGAFPANISGYKNPYASTGCGNNPLVVAVDGNCKYNSQAVIGIVPEVETYSFLGRGTLKLTDTLNAIAEYVHAETKTISTVAPDVVFGYGSDYYIPSTSPYYPGKGIVPSVGANDEQLSLSLRSQAGNRVSENKTTSDRVLLGLDGGVGKWDINTGLSFAKSIAKDSIVSGYLNNDLVRENLANGTLNPFGASADAGIWQSMSVTGLSQKAAIEVTNFDFTASRPIYTLPAGDVGFAIGANLRHEKWQQSQNAAVNGIVDSLGVDSTSAPSKGSRNLRAVYTEFQVPIFKTLSAQISGRYDDYSDFGDTFNPKFAVRWQPIKQLMFRGSYSTGFRAPSLYELNSANYKTLTQDYHNDPAYSCQKDSNGNIDTAHCDLQLYTKTGGNKKLEAEKSDTYTFGTVIEPIKNLVFTIDYFNIKVKNQIGYLSETAIFNDTVKYADKFIRNADGSLNYIDQSLANLGDTKTRGIDFGVQWRSPSTQYGRLGLSFDGTYVDSYKFQTEKGGQWTEGVGKYNSGLVLPLSPVVTRWKHTANLNWNYEAWNLNLQQQFFKGYKDENANDQNHDVKDYTVYNLAGTYTGFKNTELTLGIRNLFNTTPPATNVSSNFQMGYDPRYADGLLRTYYARATYKF